MNDRAIPMARRRSFASPNPYMELSPTGRSTIPIGDPAVATWNRRSDECHNFRSRHGSGRNRNSTHNNMNQNHVDIERIRLGLDVRTTVSIILFSFPMPCLTLSSSRSCSAISRTKLIKLCLRISWMRLVMANTTLCIFALVRSLLSFRLQFTSANLL